MAEQKKSGSAWPEPPAFFLRYTTENMEQARLLKLKKVDPADVRLDFPVELLEPPPPIEGSYVVFDQQWQVSSNIFRVFFFR
jgi:mediator of RNA polymerase II transcription subunit 7